ncbi:hypothetical protein IV498_00395 [Paenarthrobacter sp. Z7-10]|uniref:hypothetical protein n=1 Tax=Paenarthrobacter sp. Z7-10 TaxID=2787635 RepID=UPI0022A9AB1D|nr:hypothetical protein [Paenarthrobacter sp. Z7-10]MCZ2401682.1 hypothetical protein [Paenarthrobacter sp. Z7-10]
MTAPKESADGSGSGSVTAPYKPILLRGVIAALFALVTVFWQQPTDLGTSLTTGIYLLASAGTILQLNSMAAVRRLGLRSALVFEVVVCAVAGLLSLFLRGPLAYGVGLGICFIVLGATGLTVGWRSRHGSALGRDWLWTGTIFFVTGVLLPFFIPLGTKALFGVVGGSAIFLAVLLLLAGLSYRHDAANAATTNAAAGTSAANDTTGTAGADAGRQDPGTR